MMRSWAYSGRRIAALVALLALAGLILSWIGSTMWAHWAPSRRDYPVQGISISAANGEINWHSIRAGEVDFAYIRATSGSNWRDPLFAHNWAEAQSNGLRYGAELAFELCRRASSQATLFITTVPRDNAALPPVVRLEFTEHCTRRPSRNLVLSELNTLLNLIEAHSGKPALLRVSPDFDDEYDIGSGINRTLWLEGNFFLPDYAARPWVMWTANSGRRIRGIEGPVEWDVVAQ